MSDRPGPDAAFRAPGLPGLDPRPAGFPDCAACPYRAAGSPAICFSCAAGGNAGSAAGPRCPVCAEALADGAPCANAVCTLDDRWFSRVHTVSEDAESMWVAVCRYKYDQDLSWADVLGRILVGYLERHPELAGYDVITTGAIYVGPRAERLWDYLSLVVDAARRCGPDRPFAPGLIAKAAPSHPFRGLDAGQRREVAESSLREVLSVPDAARVAGRRVLVFDDVYSEGFSLREMARALRLAGAAEVAGLVLTRRKNG